MNYPYEYGIHLDAPQPQSSPVSATIAAILATIAGLFAAAGAILSIAASALGCALAAFALAYDADVGTVAAVVLCGTTLVLAALPHTGRWIAGRKLGTGPFA
ncbi:hypothetical protein [Nocardia shimofusensis]|uniref:hypothetical protein n=1 Tax=Nocardia shimofusensis TaxID=228596 RepID=UPI00082A9F62|nr:hypothetical protein [Nocardia shimofusensis]